MKNVYKPTHIREQQHLEEFNQETSYLERRATHFGINNSLYQSEQGAISPMRKLDRKRSASVILSSFLSGCQIASPTGL